MKHTHTVVELDVSAPAYTEIAEKLRAAGYDHVFDADGVIDMTGIGLTITPEAAVPADGGPTRAEEVLGLSLLDDVAREFLSTRTIDALLNGRLRTIGDVLARSPEDLRRVRNIGGVAIASIGRLRRWVNGYTHTVGSEPRLALLERMYIGHDARGNSSVAFLLGEVAQLSNRLREVEREREFIARFGDEMKGRAENAESALAAERSASAELRALVREYLDPENTPVIGGGYSTSCRAQSERRAKLVDLAGPLATSSSVAVVVDPTIPPGEMHARVNGRTVAKIVNLDSNGTTINEKARLDLLRALAFIRERERERESEAEVGAISISTRAVAVPGAWPSHVPLYEADWEHPDDDMALAARESAKLGHVHYNDRSQMVRITDEGVEWLREHDTAAAALSVSKPDLAPTTAPTSDAP